MRIRKRNNRGFSIVECVIALAVIIVVSLTALSILLSSVSAKITAVNKIEAQNFADSAWECFKASDTQEEFIENMIFSENVTLTGEQSENAGYTHYTYECAEHSYTAILDVKYSDTERSELRIEVLDKDDESIISFSYQKGDGQ